MAKADRSSVLIIDDQREGAGLALVLKGARVATRILHPEEVEIGDLEWADLVLVDYQLDHWPKRGDSDGTPISRRPMDGLALVSVLRRHIHRREKASPTAFAILTGKIEQLAAPMPPEHREHVLARITNLEWVFRKAKPGEEYDLAGQIAVLSRAVKRLPKEWSGSAGGDATSQLSREVLGFDPEEPQNSQRVEDVAGCIPPIHELSQWSHGLAVLRWLLHRILPYPCFLWDSHHLAARLHVDHAWLVNSLQKSAGLRKLLSPSKYTGMLMDFSGPRWWRSSVELALWEQTKGQSFDKTAIWGVLRKITRKQPVRSSPEDHPIVCVNRHYQPLEKFASMQDAVRIRPDDWPSYADQAWTTVELAQSEPQMRALVISEDRGKLNAHAER